MTARLSVIILLVILTKTGYSFSPVPVDSSATNKIHSYQIHLQKPAKAIKLLMYEKNFQPVQGRLSEDKKSIIMNDYEQGNKVHVRVIYEDGTTDEFVRSPCYIDPFIDA